MYSTRQISIFSIGNISEIMKVTCFGNIMYSYIQHYYLISHKSIVIFNNENRNLSFMGKGSLVKSTNNYIFHVILGGPGEPTLREITIYLLTD